MRNFKEPHYTGPECKCCKTDAQKILEKLAEEQKRTGLGFIQYKRIEELLKEI